MSFSWGWRQWCALRRSLPGPASLRWTGSHPNHRQTSRCPRPWPRAGKRQPHVPGQRWCPWQLISQWSGGTMPSEVLRGHCKRAAARRGSPPPSPCGAGPMQGDATTGSGEPVEIGHGHRGTVTVHVDPRSGTQVATKSRRPQAPAHCIAKEVTLPALSSLPRHTGRPLVCALSGHVHIRPAFRLARCWLCGACAGRIPAPRQSPRHRAVSSLSTSHPPTSRSRPAAACGCCTPVSPV